MSPELSLPRDKILVIGLGNELRADDAAGLQVARLLQRRNLPGVQVREFTGDGAEMMEAWAGFPLVIVIDATRPVKRAGTVYRFAGHHQPLPAAWFNLSTHSFGLAEAVELSRSLQRMPDELIVYGIEGGNFGLGHPVSSAVAASIQSVFEAALAEIQERLPSIPPPLGA